MRLSRTKRKNNSMIIAGLFLSGLVGAGFGSGREIFVYFASLGPVGILGFALSCTLLGLASVRILTLANQERFTCVRQVSHFVTKGKLATLFTVTVLSFAFIGYVAMLSGIRDVLQPVFPAVNGRYAHLFGICTGGIVAAFSLMAFYGDFPTFARICAIVTPGIIFCVAAVSLIASFTAPAHSSSGNVAFPGLASLVLKSGVYIGYNLLFLLGVLGRAGGVEASSGEIRRGTLLGAGLFFTCGTCIFIGLSVLPPSIARNSMPLPAAIATLGVVPGQIFSCVLAFAMILCAACNFGAVGSAFGKKPLVCTLLAVLAIPVSYIGFDRVISVIYPFFGFVGILFLLTLAQTRRKIV